MIPPTPEGGVIRQISLFSICQIKLVNELHEDSMQFLHNSCCFTISHSITHSLVWKRRFTKSSTVFAIVSNTSYATCRMCASLFSNPCATFTYNMFFKLYGGTSCYPSTQCNIGRRIITVAELMSFCFTRAPECPIRR